MRGAPVMDIPRIDAGTILLVMSVLLGAGLLYDFVSRTIRGETLSVESDWGGFGGATDGWWASESLVRLLGALAVSALLTLVPLVELKIDPGGAAPDASHVNSEKSVPASEGRAAMGEAGAATQPAVDAPAIDDTGRLRRERAWLGCLTNLTIAALLAVLSLVVFRPGERLSFSSQWAGMGGGSGGWRLSQRMSFLAASAAFALLSLAPATQLMPTDSPESNASEKAANTTKAEAKPGNTAANGARQAGTQADAKHAAGESTTAGGTSPPLQQNSSNIAQDTAPAN
jgi:hypothetical protein